MERWVQVSRLQPVRSQAVLILPISSQCMPLARRAGKRLTGCHSLVCLLEGGDLCPLQTTCI